MPTRTQFLSTYERILREQTEWGRVPEKLAKFMASVTETVNTNNTTATLTNSPLAQAAFREVGCTGKLSYKALRALPL